MDTRILYKECATLAVVGYDVHLVAPETPGADTRRFGVVLHSIPRESSRLRRILLSSWRAMRLALTLKPDVLHLHDSELLLHVMWARLYCRHIVFDMHEDLPKSILDKHWLASGVRGMVSEIARYAERVLLARLPVILAEDSYGRGRAWLRRHQVVRNFPVMSEFDGIVAKPVHPWRIGYIGSITPTRGCFTLLEVVALLRARGIALGIDCIGPVSDDLADAIAVRVGELGLSDVLYHGAMPAERGYRILSSCAIGVALLHPKPNYRESYPTKVFEYMALGIPVVASDFPLYRELMVDSGAGVVVDPIDIEAIANVIEMLLLDSSARELMAERGRAAVRDRYSWEQESERLIGFYATLAST